MRFFARSLLVALLISCAPLTAQIFEPAPAPTQLSRAAAKKRPAYDALLSDARRYAAEQSWARARETYALALKIAPDAEARRWSELWMLDATWRENTAPNEDTQVRLLASLEKLIAPYVNGTPRDDFWGAVMERIAAAKRAHPWGFRKETSPWIDELAIADYLASQPNLPAEATRYAEFLLRMLAQKSDYLRPDDAQREQLLQHLVQAGRVVPDTNLRAHLTLRTADYAAQIGMPAGRCESLYATAMVAARGTPLQPVTHAREFLWRVDTGLLTADANRRPDLPAWIAELESHLRSLEVVASSEPLRDPTRKALTELRNHWTERRIELSIDDVFRPDEPVRFTVGSAYASKLNFEIHRVSPHDWQAAQRRASDGASVVLPIREDRVMAWELDLTAATAPYLWQSHVVTTPEALPPGLYLLAARDENDRYRARPFLVTTAAATALRIDDHRWEFFCYDNQSGEPLKPNAVEAWFSSKETGTSNEPVAMIPGGDGQVVVSYTENRNPRSAILWIKDSGPVCFDSLYDFERWKTPEEELHVDLVMPRELYRPGETVPFKLIARHRRDHRFVKPVGQLTLKAVLDEAPIGEPLEITWDDDGAASGEIAIPAGTKPGRVELQLFSGADERQSVDFFTIDNFLPPPAFVELDLAEDATALRRGSLATFRVKAWYFSGGPLAGAPVEFRLQPNLPWRRSLADAEEERKRDAVWAHQIGGNVFRAVTDVDGVATCSIDMPAFLPEVFSVYARCTVKPSGLPEITRSESFTATASGLQLALANGDHPRVVVPGEKITVRFQYLGPLERAAPVSGEVSLIEDRWQEVWLDPEGNPVSGDALIEARRAAGIIGDGALPAAWKRIHAGNAATVIATEDAVGGADGWATVSFTMPHAGVFHFAFNADTGPVFSRTSEYTRGYGEPCVAARVYAVDETTRALALPPTKELVIAPAEIAAGETPRFLVVLPEGVHRGWLAVSGESETRTRAFSTQGRVALVALDDPPAFSTRGSVQVITPQDGFYAEAPTEFAVRQPAAQIHTEIVTPASEFRPGARGEVTLRTRDSEGGAVAATVTLGVSDQAVNELLSPGREIASRFLGYGATAETRGFKSLAWKKKQIVVRLRDPREGLRFYETVTSGEDELLLNAFSVKTASEDSFGAMGESGTVMRQSALLADAGGECVVKGRESLKNGARLDPSSDETDGESSLKPAITLRRHFVSTAFWAPAVKTDATGEARVTVTYPDNLTEWRLAAYSIGKDGNSFGTATAFTRTTLPLQARLSAPRFLVAGDSATVTGTLVNRSEEPVSAQAELALAGDSVRWTDDENATRDGLTVEKNNEARASWRLQAITPGEAALTLSARTGASGDAMRLMFPVEEDGIQQSTAASARLADDATSVRFMVDLPKPLDPARTRVSLQLSPTRAAAVLDALPYLIDYPYGCVEQTMSRFLPAIVVRRTLNELGFDEAAVERRILAEKTSAGFTRRAKTAGFAKLDEVVAQSLARLGAAQRGDGSFGWWPGQGEADLWMTAYVSWGLALAGEAGIDIPDTLAENANEALEELLSNHLSVDDTIAWALAAAARALDEKVDGKTKAAFQRVYDGRNKLSASGRACLLLAVTHCGTAEQRAILLRNLENGATRVRSGDFGDTANWGSTGRSWRASENAVETTALTVLALLENEPTHPLIEPAVNWLVLNRRSGNWSNTRDTAFAALALSRYLALSKEREPDAEVDVIANGKPLRRVKLDRDTVLVGGGAIPQLARAGV